MGEGKQVSYFRHCGQQTSDRHRWSGAGRGPVEYRGRMDAIHSPLLSRILVSSEEQKGETICNSEKRKRGKFDRT